MSDAISLVSRGGAWMPADPDLPLLRGDDLAATRGDGVFEAIGVFGGMPLALEAHAERLRRSMVAVGLTAWDASVIRAGVVAAIEQHPPAPELLVKVYVSHGPEGAAPWSWIDARLPADHRSARRDGVSVVTLDRGVARGAGAHAPWMLAGVKSLSYAPQRAALREAHRRGADDAVYVSSDGYLLEGQASTLLLLRGDEFSTPDPADGALAGTTQEHLFAGLARAGRATAVRSVRVEELESADAAWLCSSGRLITPIHAVDGHRRAVSAAATAVLWQALGLAVRPAGATAPRDTVPDTVLQTASGPSRGNDHE